jgi:hypothetical protein
MAEGTPDPGERIVVIRFEDIDGDRVGRPIVFQEQT